MYNSVCGTCTYHDKYFHLSQERILCGSSTSSFQCHSHILESINLACIRQYLNSIAEYITESHAHCAMASLIKVAFVGRLNAC